MAVVLSVAKCALFSMVNHLYVHGVFADNEDGRTYQIGEPEYPAPESLKSEAELKKMMVVEFVPENVHYQVSCGIVMWKFVPSIHRTQYQLQPEAPVWHYIRTMTALQQKWMNFASGDCSILFDFTFNDHGTAPTWFKLSFAKFAVCEYRPCYVFP